MSGGRVLLLLALLLAGEFALQTEAASDNKDKGKDKESSSSSSSSSRKKSPPYKYRGPWKRSPPPTVGSPPPAPPEPKNEVCRTYTVQPGDSTMSVSQSQRVNYEELITALSECIGYQEGQFLQVGQAICLPPYTQSCRFVSSASGIPECKVYTVQMGDTLGSIATTFGLYTEHLEESNSGLLAAGQPLSAGNKLRLPPWDDAVCKDSGTDAPPCRVYKIKEGETMFAVASTFRTTTEEIIAVNQGMDANTPLKPGENLKIPPFTADCGAGTPVTGPPVEDITTCRAYIVESGESLNSIALKYGLSANDVAALNEQVSNPALVGAGTRIKLPPWDDMCPENGTVINTPVFNTPSTVETSEVPTGQQVAVGPPTLIYLNPPVKVNTSASVIVNRPSPASGGTTKPATAPTSTPSSSTAPKSKVEMVLEGVSATEFPSKQDAIVSIVAQAAGVPPEAVVVMFALPVLKATGRRRLSDSSDAVKMQSTITGDPNAILANLRNAGQDGSMDAAFKAEGLTLEGFTYISPSGMATELVTAPATPATDTSSESGGSAIPIGIVIGAACGGVALIAIIVAVCCCVSKRRKAKKLKDAKTSSGSKPRYGSVNAYVTVGGSKAYRKDGTYDPELGERTPSRSTPRIAAQPEGSYVSYDGSGFKGGARSTPGSHPGSRARSRNGERRTPRGGMSSRGSDDAESLAHAEVTVPRRSSPPAVTPPPPAPKPVPVVVVAAPDLLSEDPAPRLVAQPVSKPAAAASPPTRRVSSGSAAAAAAAPPAPRSIPVISEPATAETTNSSAVRKSSESMRRSPEPFQAKPLPKVAAQQPGASQPVAVVRSAPRVEAPSSRAAPRSPSKVTPSPTGGARALPRVATLGTQRPASSPTRSSNYSAASRLASSPSRPSPAAAQRPATRPASPQRVPSSVSQKAPLTQSVPLTSSQRAPAPSAQRSPSMASQRTSVPVARPQATTTAAPQRSPISSAQRAPLSSPQRSPTRSPQRSPTKAPPRGGSLASYAEF